ncbi:ATP-grasp domain-containing protein [Streptomyces boluensis]|uniref:ATP-grasp domain-containing protein n=1 Tax=Streptomyces boluensis TaxID=1775135 RepID=A0A964XJE6_9ACTN|nr:ATP-grasp domain-containing protein [Streptomyces boluensis]NBE49971.1 ATP-grasp domain-containing protein [Streptomyces boluensis]
MTHPRTPRRLLMVMPYHQLVRKAVAAGFEVWSIWDPSLQTDAYLDEVERHSEELLLVDFSNTYALRALIAATARTHAIDTVLHLGSEDSMGPAVEEAEALGLAPNPAETVRRINDKAALRELLNAGGLSVVRSQEVASVDAVVRAAPDFPVPFVVKPARSSGSRGIALVLDAEDLDEWVVRVRRAGLRGPFVLEEYLRGPEFSVETLTVDGVHHVVGITAKQHTGAPGFVETGHVFPARISPDAETAVRATVIGLLDLAGYRFGPAHTEVILTSRGPRIVESQTRLGGDRIPALVELASGFDLEAAVFRALAGEAIEVPKAHRAASIGFFQLPPGHVESISGLDELRAQPHVHALHFPYRPGSVLPPVTDSASRHGFVVVDAESPGQAVRRIAAAREAVRVVVREQLATTQEGSVC